MVGCLSWRPRNSQSWASIAVFLTFVIYSMSSLSVLFHLREASLFYVIYYPAGLVASIYGIYAVKTANFYLNLTYTVAHAIMYSLLVYKSFTTVYLNISGLKIELQRDCIQGNINSTDQECSDLASSQVQSTILSVSVMIIIMSVFLFLLSTYTFLLKFPIPPEYDEEFGKEEFELPAYQPGTDRTSPLPPSYQSPETLPAASTEDEIAVENRIPPPAQLA